MNRNPHSRESLATLFWPESDRTHSLASLRQCLMELQNRIGEKYLNINGETVSFSAEQSVWCDVEEFRKSVTLCRSRAHDSISSNYSGAYLSEEAVQHCENALELYTGDFLEGFTLPDSVQFDDWQTLETESLRQEYVSLLKLYIADLERRGFYSKAILYSRKLIHIDPLDEDAHRNLMRFLYYEDNRHAALLQYTHCAQTLEEELGISPEEETERIYQSIKKSTLPLLKAPPPGEEQMGKEGRKKPTRKGNRWPLIAVVVIGIIMLASAYFLFYFPYMTKEHPLDEVTIAVLPFTGIGADDHTAQWTSRGLTELLATKLTKHTSTWTVKRTAVYAYSNPPVTHRQIGRDLDARFLIEGAVLNTHNELTVLARLIDTGKNAYIWKSQYSPGDEDVLLFLDSTASEIAASILHSIETISTNKQREED